MFGGFMRLAAMQQREWRDSADRFDRTAYGGVYGGALLLFAGPPLVLAGVVGLVGDSPIAACIGALLGAVGQVPLARWLAARYPELRIAPHLLARRALVRSRRRSPHETRLSSGGLFSR